MKGVPRLMPTRAELVKAIREGLQSCEFVYAAWLEGADAADQVDEYSDIDVWLDVEDGRENDGVDEVRRILESFGTLELDLEVDHPHPLIKQVFLRTDRVSEFLIVDLCLQCHSREFVFDEGKAHESVQVLFDKADVIRFRRANKEAMQAVIREHARRLAQSSQLFSTRVRKEIARGNFLEALGAYHRLVLEPLVEALRLRSAPTKADFHLKDVTRDLPADDVHRLALFYTPPNLEEIERLLPQANEWMREILEPFTDEAK